MTVLVGCSGWSYDDWVGRFYPVELARKKGDWLAYYAEYFHTVEINSTFYRPPGERQVESWINKGRGLFNFEYSVKVPQLVTHKLMVEGDTARAVHEASSFEMTCLQPLAGAGLLGGVLLQLSPYFKRQDSSLHALESVLEALRGDCAVEFRHRSWLDAGKKEIDAEALQVLTERNAASVLVDGPGLPATSERTADHCYLRFHGRNYDIWFGDEKENDYRLNRYDYLYTQDQLDPWVPRITEAELKAQMVRVYFNNHARSKSVKNAFQLMDMLALEHKPKEIRLQDQFKLGSFQ